MSNPYSLHDRLYKLSMNDLAARNPFAYDMLSQYNANNNKTSEKQSVYPTQIKENAEIDDQRFNDYYLPTAKTTVAPTSYSGKALIGNGNSTVTINGKTYNIRNKNDVIALQQFLKENGQSAALGTYGVNGDGVDGKFGRSTFTALQNFINANPNNFAGSSMDFDGYKKMIYGTTTNPKSGVIIESQPIDTSLYIGNSSNIYGTNRLFNQIYDDVQQKVASIDQRAYYNENGQWILQPVDDMQYAAKYRGVNPRGGIKYFSTPEEANDWSNEKNDLNEFIDDWLYERDRLWPAYKKRKRR